jgi:hypothetical protein
MADEALRVPIELVDCRFTRSLKSEEFARFLLNTVPGSYKPDPELGCRSPYFTPEYTDDLKNDIRNRVLDQFQRYMGITVNVAISERIQTVTAFCTCHVSGRAANGEKFSLSWEV